MEENKKPENPQAFPMDYDHQGYRMETGMTLRDYFANSAMIGILNNGLSTSEEYADEAYKIVAVNAYKLADAMLKQRELNQE